MCTDRTSWGVIDEPTLNWAREGNVGGGEGGGGQRWKVGGEPIGCPSL